MSATASAIPERGDGRRRWIVRLVRLAIVLVAARLLLAALAPFAVQLVARAYGFDVDWSAVRLHVLRGAVEVESIRTAVRAAEGTAPNEPFLRVESLRLDLGLRALLRGRLNVERAEVSGVDLLLERRVDGSLPLFAALDAALAGDEKEKESAEPPAPLDLEAPVEIDVLRVEGARIRIADERAHPGRTWHVDVDVRGDRLGRAEETGHLALHASAPGLCADARLAVELDAGPDAARARAEFQAVGLHSDALSAWVPGLRADPKPRPLDASGTLTARARVAGAARDELAGSLEVEALQAVVDGRTVAFLANASAEIATLRADGVRIAQLEVDAGHLEVRRAADGLLCVLGFALDPAAPPANAETASTPPPATAAFRLAADAVHLRALGLVVEDEVYDPAPRLAVNVESCEITSFDTQPANVTPITVDARAGMPGFAAELRLHGTASLFAERKAIDVALEVDGLAPSALEPHLLELGLASTLTDGKFRAHLVGSGQATPDGRIEGDLRLREVELRGGSQPDARELFAVHAVELKRVVVDPSLPLVRADELLVRGTTVPLARSKDGALEGFGLRAVAARSTRRLGASAPTVPAAPPAVSGAASPATAALPRIEVGRLAILQNRVSWRDDTLPTPVDVVFDDCGLEVSGLALFGAAGRHTPATAEVKLWSRAQDLVKNVEVNGRVTTKPGPLDLAVELAGQATGISALRLQPYIHPTGIEERLQEAAVSGALTFAVVDEPGGLRANLEVRDAELRNADQSVTGARLVRVRDARFGPERIDIASIEVEAGRFHVARDPVGALLALGFRIPLSVFQRAPAEGESPPVDVQSDDSSKAEALLADLPDVRVGSLRAKECELVWRDVRIDPPVATAARLDLAIDHLATRRSDPPARFQVDVSLAETLEAIHVEGTALLDPSEARIDARCTSRGLRAGALAPYLPAGLACELRDGRFAFEGAINVEQHPAGGLRAGVSVHDARLVEGEGGEALAACSAFELEVDRADPAAQVFELGALRVAGLEVDVRRGTDGALRALGFALDARTDSPTTPEAESVASTETGGGLPDLSLPETARIRIGTLDLELRSLRFRDELRGTAPVELSARLSAPEGQVVVDADPAALPPLRLTLEGSLSPLARRWSCELECAPWAEEPLLRARCAAQGLSGAALAAIDAALPVWVDGSALRDGVASGSVAARLRWKRRSPLDLDLRNGFAADVEIGRLELRAAPEGDVLAALDGGEAEIARVDLARGLVHVKTLELRRPELRAGRAADGFHVLGLVLHPELRPVAETPAIAPEPAEPEPREHDAPLGEPVIAAAPASAAALADELADELAGELRVDELVVRGLDVELRDDAGTPPSVLPLNDLDVIVQGFSTRAFREPLPLRFDAWLAAGDAEMPVTSRTGSLLESFASVAGGAVQVREEHADTQKRRVFQEAALTGRVQLVPALTGHAQMTLSGFELLGFTGTARQAGVEVNDGLLDASVRMRFRGDEGVRVDSEFVFSDLSLSEPTSGPVETWLTLPVSLDAVLFLLQNAEGEHRIPVGFTVDEEGLTQSRIVGAASGAAASVIASAVASAPLRILSTFTDLFGDGGDEDPPPSATLVFAPGSTTLSAEALAALQPLVEMMRADSDLVVQVQHRFGPADVERAELLANPSIEDASELSRGLRRRRAELGRARAELAADARAAWGVGDRETAEAAGARLRALDAQAGTVEDALDRALELTRPGVERYREKRTRAAALAVARERIVALRAWLAGQGLRDLDERFQSRTPSFDAGPDGQPGTLLAVLRERQG